MPRGARAIVGPYRDRSHPIAEPPRGLVVRRPDGPEDLDAARRRAAHAVLLAGGPAPLAPPAPRAAPPEPISPERARRFDRRVRACLVALGIAALLFTIDRLSPIVIAHFEEPLLTWQGVRNLGFHLLHGEGLAGLRRCADLALEHAPWLVFPWLALLVARRRAIGWLGALVVAAFFLATPMFALALLVLVDLLLHHPFR